VRVLQEISGLVLYTCVLGGVSYRQPGNDAAFHPLLIVQVALSQCTLQARFLDKNETEKGHPPYRNEPD